MISTLHVPEREAQAVLLVRAFEQADTEGKVLPRSEVAAVEAALPAGQEPAEKRLVRRARRLLAVLEERVSLIPGFLRASRLGGTLRWAVLLGALVLGLASNLVGPARRINLLAVPLWAILGWNLLMYCLFVLAWVVQGRASAGGRGPSRMLVPASAWLFMRRAVARLRADRQPAATVILRAMGGYLGAWSQAARPLLEARARRLLHLGAIALMAGAVAGMYLRGLAFEYRASWESTFLSPAAAHGLLGAVLGPAARLLGVELPSLAELRSGEGDAAVWIHLFAVTAGLFVVLPRALLAGVETARCQLWARRVPLDASEAYLRRQLAAGRNEALRVEVLPYSFQPLSLTALREALRERYGERAELAVAAPVAYGEPLPDADPTASPPARVLLFNLAQTPEAEVHGELLAGLRGGDYEELLVLLDAAGYRQRLGPGAAAEVRFKERRRAWDDLAGAVGASLIHVDLAAMNASVLGDLLAEAAAARR